jgi:hypothetical protein
MLIRTPCGLDVETYTDDVGAFNNDWESHLQSIDKILRHLEINGFKVNPLLGAVTSYYCDMWPKHSHILTPLMEFTGKGKFIWEDWHPQVLEQMKVFMLKDTLLAYPSHNLSFEIYDPVLRIFSE